MARDGLWWLAKIANRVTSNSSSDKPYIIRFLDDPGPVKIDLQQASYTTSNFANYGSWCLHRHKTGSLARGVLRNPDASRVATTVSIFSRFSIATSACLLFLQAT